MDVNPPAYHDVIQKNGNCPPSAPALTHLDPRGSPSATILSLDESLFPLPETVHFSLCPGSACVLRNGVFNSVGIFTSDDAYTFCVRDARNNCLLIRGKFTNSVTVDLFNANGQIFLKINNNRAKVDGSIPGNSSKYVVNSTVMHNDMILGRIECHETDLNGISATNVQDNYNFLINCIGSTNRDLVISTIWNSPPLCTANITSSPRGYGPSSFNATLVFAAESSITKVEQCMCFAIIVTFIQARNKAQVEEDHKNNLRIAADNRAKLLRSQVAEPSVDLHSSAYRPLKVAGDRIRNRACIVCFVFCILGGLLIWAFFKHIGATRNKYRM